MKIITQIGSLPYDEPKKAVEYSLRHDIPFLPELHKLGDSMLQYIQNPGKLSCLDEFSNAVRGYDLVKAQCIGPATLMQNNYTENQAIERIYHHMYAILDNLDAGKVIFFLDEPALGYTGIDYKTIWRFLFQEFDVIPGVHVCGNTDWDRLFNSDLEIISHDTSLYDITRYPEYRDGKRIAWGISKPEDVKDFQEGDLITPPCGLGPKIYTEDDAERTLDMLISAKELY